MMDDTRQHPEQGETAAPVQQAAAPSALRSRRTSRRDDPVTLGLKQLWADLEQEAVPDEFLDLLDQIDRRTGSGQAE
mgnify:CR=1 FL=1